MEFSRKEYWSGVPLPYIGDLPDLGMEPRSPILYRDALPSEPPGNRDVKDAILQKTVVMMGYLWPIRGHVESLFRALKHQASAFADGQGPRRGRGASPAG